MVRGRVHVVRLTAVRDELVAALEETLQLARRLAADARDGEVPVAELVAQASMLGRLDQRRENLIGQLRREASAGVRASRPGLPVRVVVLAALDELGWPQNARFLEEYLWARRELQVDSRAFASLRRDELRAWQRSPGARSAYIVPALNPDGSANPRWLTSSAWVLSRRVVASPESERLFRPAQDPRPAGPRLPRAARHAARAVRGADPGHRPAAGLRLGRRHQRVACARARADGCPDRAHPQP
jgi:hypothetical protein